jgi:phosphate:Na+ symporter
MSLFTIAAGVVLILLGMRHLRKGLDRLLGGRLAGWLRTMTTNRWRGFFAGMGMGVVAPSSTSLALLSVQMLRKSSVSSGRMLAVVLGANVGLTVTVQLLALRLDQGAPVLLVLGGGAFLFMRRPLFRGLGQAVLAFGLIFLAMQLIGNGARELVAGGELDPVLQLMERSPWLLMFGVAALSVLLQSSTAAIALGLALGRQGVLSAAALVPWVVGTNLGICCTALIAGWGSLEGRRLGWSNLLLKATGGAVLVGSAPLWLGAWAFTPDRLVADLHTGFNLVLGLTGVLLITPLGRLMEFLVEDDRLAEGSAGDCFLDPLLLQSPSLALNQTTRELFRLVDMLKLMLGTTQQLAEARQSPLASVVAAHHRRFQHMHAAIIGYAGQISEENLSPQDAHWKFLLLDYAQELAAIALIIRRDLTDTGLKLVLSSVEPGPAAALREDVSALIRRTLDRMEQATSLLMSRDPVEAEAYIQEKERISHWSRRARRLHQTHVPTLAPEVARVAAAHLDQLDCLRRINSHLSSLAYSLARRRNPDDPEHETEPFTALPCPAE